jgi:hypothetical protein
MKFKKSEERITYQTLKVWALDSYFDFCRDSGLVSQWSHEQVNRPEIRGGYLV